MLIYALNPSPKKSLCPGMCPSSSIFFQIMIYTNRSHHAYLHQLTCGFHQFHHSIIHFYTLFCGCTCSKSSPFSLSPASGLSSLTRAGQPIRHPFPAFFHYSYLYPDHPKPNNNHTHTDKTSSLSPYDNPIQKQYS